MFWECIQPELSAEEIGDLSMMIDLLYDGPLPSASWNGTKPRTAYTQSVRSCFALQLQELMRVESLQKRIDARRPGRITGHRLVPIESSKAEVEDDRYRNAAPYLELGGQKYIPLITRSGGQVCDLSFLILAPKSGHNDVDTDNRVKLLLDALRIPHCKNEVEGHPALVDPCYCLLEDDGDDLISKRAAESRTRLKVSSIEGYVQVWIQVTVRKPKQVIETLVSAPSSW